VGTAPRPLRTALPAIRAEIVTPVRAFVVAYGVSTDAAALARDLAVRAGVVVGERESAACLAAFFGARRSVDI
jgi:hypothetical protein